MLELSTNPTELTSSDLPGARGFDMHRSLNEVPSDGRPG